MNFLAKNQNVHTSKFCCSKELIKNIFNFELWLWCITHLPCSIVLSLLREIRNIEYLIFSLNYGMGPHWPFWIRPSEFWPEPGLLVWQSWLGSVERLGSYLGSNFEILAESYGPCRPVNLVSKWLETGPSNLTILGSNFWKPWFVLLAKLVLVLGWE